MRKRRIVNFAVIALLIALLVLSSLHSGGSYALPSFLFIIIALIPFFMAFEHKRPAAREIVPIAVLAAIAAIGRIIFAPLPEVKPTTAIVMVAGYVFGPSAGFMTGAIAAFSSNFFFGQGAFTPWQMFAWGIIGFISGLLGRRELLKGRLRFCAVGFVFAFIFGWIMDIWQIIGFVSPINAASIWLTFASSFYFDLTHAVSTVVFLLAISKPWTEILRRVKLKYGLLTHRESGNLI